MISGRSSRTALPRAWTSLFAWGLLGAAALWTPWPAVAQDEAAETEAGGVDAAEVAGEDRSTTTYVVTRATSPIKIDAILDEQAWADALVIDLNVETRPAENTPAPVRTEGRITFDESALYVAFHAYDPDPSKIRAHLTDRDKAFSDDFIGIVVDTFNDERRGFEFFVNPLGVQMDLFNDDVGGNETESWDAIWDSAGRIVDDGYIVEFAVPFHQLRFPATSGEQIWGLDAIRFYPREDRVRIATQPLDRGTNCYLCQISKMRGFEGITPGRNIELIPTATGSQTDSRADFPDGPIEGGSFDGDPGLTARWGITPNLTLNAALNPDFSQVEADVAQLAVNEQFALFFPERRPFFLEGADFFDTPLRAVFTRNVADPTWGLKFSGKQGANAFGVFVAEDEITNLLFPGSQRSSGGSFDFETRDTVVRYRRDLKENSALGLIFTDRRGDDYSNQVAGVDGLLRFKDSHTVRFQGLTSGTEYPGAIQEDFDQPGGSFSDTAWRVNYNYDTRNWFVYTRYEDIGADFRADLGFIPQVGRTFLLGGAQRVWWGEDEQWYNRLSFGGDWDLTEDEAGNVLEKEAELQLNIDMPKEAYLFFGAGMRDRFFDGRVYPDQSFVNLFYEIRPVGDLELSIFAGGGDTIDFANNQPAEQVLIEPSVSYDFGLRTRAVLSHDYRRLDVDGGELFTANLSQLRLVYQFNVRSFVRATLQYTDISRDPSLYSDEVDAKTERLFTQLLYSYKINPQTVLFLGYSDSRAGDQDVDLTQQNRTLFVKFGYAWVL